MAAFPEPRFRDLGPIEYRHATFDDGTRDSFRLDRPFYSLDSRWAAGVAASTYDRIDSIYSTSNIIGQYRHRNESGQVYGGLLKGLVDGWVHRYSIGVLYQNDTYRADPLLATPSQVPSDLSLVAPFVRYGVVEDHFKRSRIATASSARSISRWASTRNCNWGAP